jgi:ferritin
MEKTTDADMQRLYDYMNKMGASYTINRNPSPEEIKRIKAQIEKNEKKS